MIQEYLKTLNLTEETLSDLQKNYNKLILKHHPDRGGTSQQFIKIRKAYLKINEYLKNKDENKNSFFNSNSTLSEYLDSEEEINDIKNLFILFNRDIKRVKEHVILSEFRGDRIDEICFGKKKENLIKNKKENKNKKNNLIKKDKKNKKDPFDIQNLANQIHEQRMKRHKKFVDSMERKYGKFVDPQLKENSLKIGKGNKRNKKKL